MALWFFNKAYSCPPILRPKLLFAYYLAKRLIVMPRCAVNVTISSFQHLPRSLGVKVVFRKRKFIILKITFWSSDQRRTYSF